MNKFTKAVKAKYLAQCGQYCPYCDSDDIEAGPLDADGATAQSRVKCNACGREWWDIYRLVDVECT